MKIKNQEDDFYRELDKNSIKKSCCTWQIMIVFFSLLLILLLILVFMIFNKIRSGNFTLPNLNNISVSKDSILKKLNNISKNESEISLTFDEIELSSIFGQEISVSLLEIRNISASIGDNQVIVYGKLIRPFKSNLKVETQPIVKNDKLYFEVKSSQAGMLNLPNYFNKKIEEKLNDAIDENFKDIYQSYLIFEVIAQDQKLTINGKLK